MHLEPLVYMTLKAALLEAKLAEERALRARDDAFRAANVPIGGYQFVDAEYRIEPLSPATPERSLHVPSV